MAWLEVPRSICVRVRVLSPPDWWPWSLFHVMEISFTLNSSPVLLLMVMVDKVLPVVKIDPCTTLLLLQIKAAGVT